MLKVGALPPPTHTHFLRLSAVMCMHIVLYVLANFNCSIDVHSEECSPISPHFNVAISAPAKAISEEVMAKGMVMILSLQLTSPDFTPPPLPLPLPLPPPPHLPLPPLFPPPPLTTISILGSVAGAQSVTSLGGGEIR